VNPGITTRGAPLASLARRCWHAVATLQELRASAPSPLAVTLLGEPLAIAELAAGTASARVVAFADRCPHRSAKLSLGTVESRDLRCAYHGWRFGSDGR
jgi:phenylpropionate dioxygenase-like ring-hydroxylating dioxygenase large terminal subunit